MVRLDAAVSLQENFREALQDQRGEGESSGDVDSEAGACR